VKLARRRPPVLLEFGIFFSHLALAADRVRRGFRLLGAALGLAGGWAVARLLAEAVPALPGRDPLVFAVVTTTLIGTALLACYVPARRATRVNPMEALRHE